MSNIPDVTTEYNLYNHIREAISSEIEDEAEQARQLQELNNDQEWMLMLEAFISKSGHLFDNEGNDRG